MEYSQALMDLYFEAPVEELDAEELVELEAAYELTHHHVED